MENRDNKKLNTLFEFQLILLDIQSKITKAMVDGVSKSRVENMIKMYDDLKRVYDNYDKFYFDEVVTRSKYSDTTHQLIEAYKTIDELRKENKKLNDMLQWNQPTP